MPVGEAYSKIVPKIVGSAKRLKIGYGLDLTNEMGPVISNQAKTRIISAIDQAVTQGAALLLDGRQPSLTSTPGIDLSQGSFVGPTILDQVTPDMDIFSTEIFGPVLAIVSASTLKEAISFIHKIPYGNAASIYTQSGKSAQQFSKNVVCRNIGVNIGIAAPMAFFPFGGARRSFYGDLHAQGRDGINFYTDRKVVITKW